VNRLKWQPVSETHWKGLDRTGALFCTIVVKGDFFTYIAQLTNAIGNRLDDVTVFINKCGSKQEALSLAVERAKELANRSYDNRLRASRRRTIVAYLITAVIVIGVSFAVFALRNDSEAKNTACNAACLKAGNDLGGIDPGNGRCACYLKAVPK